MLSLFGLFSALSQDLGSFKISFHECWCHSSGPWRPASFASASPASSLWQSGLVALMQAVINSLSRALPLYRALKLLICQRHLSPPLPLRLWPGVAAARMCVWRGRPRKRGTGWSLAVCWAISHDYCLFRPLIFRALWFPSSEQNGRLTLSPLAPSRPCQTAGESTHTKTVTTPLLFPRKAQGTASWLSMGAQRTRLEQTLPLLWFQADILDYKVLLNQGQFSKKYKEIKKEQMLQLSFVCNFTLFQKMRRGKWMQQSFKHPWSVKAYRTACNSWQSCRSRGSIFPLWVKNIN